MLQLCDHHAGLHTPEDIEELQGCAAALSASLELIAAEIPCSDEQREAALQVTLEHAVSACQALDQHLQQLQADAGQA